MPAKKLLPIVDGVPGTIIPIRDGRISTDNPQNGQALVFDSSLGEFVNQSLDTTDVLGIYLRSNHSTRPVSTRCYRYRILFSSPDNSKWVPANSSTSTNATAIRDVTQAKINPFGRIVYYFRSSAISENTNVATDVQYDQRPVPLGYSFNRTGAALNLTYPAPVYVKCAPQSDGSAIIDATTPYTQLLPTTKDGKIYIYLGQAYNATDMELSSNHPVYYHDGLGIKEWTGQNEIFRCEMQTSDGYGNLIGGITNADVQAAVAAGKTVYCTMYDDVTNAFTLLVATQGTPISLMGTNIVNNSILYCFVATPVSGSGSTTWTVQYTAVQTNSMLPALAGNSGKVLAVNSNASGVEWTTPDYGDLTNKPVLVCDYNTSTNQISGLTAAQIVTAVAAGTDVLCRVDDTIFMVCDFAYEDENDELQIQFHSIDNDEDKICYVNCRSGTWTYDELNLKLKTINDTTLRGNGNISLPTTLRGLGDTTIAQRPNDNDTLVYDATAAKWKNGEYYNYFHATTYTLAQPQNGYITHSLTPTHTREYVVFDCGNLSGNINFTLNIYPEYGGASQTGSPSELYVLLKNIGTTNTCDITTSIGNIKYNVTHAFTETFKPGPFTAVTGYVEFFAKFVFDFDGTVSNCRAIVTKHAEG